MGDIETASFRSGSDGGTVHAKSRSSLEADARTRTADPFITSEVLYQLSYVGEDGQV